MDIKNFLPELCLKSGSEAFETAKSALSEFAEVKDSPLSNIYGVMKGSSDYSILLDAHIDEVHFIVTSIDKDGFLLVDKFGGPDIRPLSGAEVTVLGASALYGIVCKYDITDKKAPAVDKLKIDIGFDEKEAKKRVKPGDRVVFNQVPKMLLNSCITAKSLDDRAGVASLLLAAQKLKAAGKLPVTVQFLFSQFEEIGGMGAQTGSFALCPDEALAVDVGFGDNVGVDADKCQKLGKGPQIGFSPILSSKITKKLCDIAKNKGIDYMSDVCGGRTYTNADSIFSTLSGVPCGLISIPLRSMHTPVETVSFSDIESTADLIFDYVYSGGIMR